jgi:dihydrofolate reductase
MSRVVGGMSMSLDGFVAGPNDGVGNPLGDGAERLHDWLVRLRSWREAHGLAGGETGPVDELFATSWAATGAFVMGRRMFDNGEGPWGDEPPFRKPVFVVTHRPREPLAKEGGTTFTFVDGVESAVEQAGMAAGERDVAVGGAQTIRQLLIGGLLDEIRLQVVPIFLGGGVRLFEGLPANAAELDCVEAVEAGGVAHLTFRVRRPQQPAPGSPLQ